MLPEHQFGFYTLHSTVDQLQRLTSTILCSLKQKEFYAAAFLDVALTTDLVWHEGLTVKLSHLLSSNICHLLHNCFSERSFFVFCGTYSFSLRPFTEGVRPRKRPRTNSLYSIHCGSSYSSGHNSCHLCQWHRYFGDVHRLPTSHCDPLRSCRCSLLLIIHLENTFVPPTLV